MASPRSTSTPPVARAPERSAGTCADPAQLVIVALGAVPGDLVAAVADTLRAVHELRVSIAPAGERPTFAFNPARNQYHATAILQKIASLRGVATPSAVLALTDVDLFIPDVPFVFGGADQAARSAVVSLARLVPPCVAPDRGRLGRRVLTEAMHEIGHVFGLAHCDDVQCAMRQSRVVSEVDAKRPDLCATCRRRISTP
jgi:archaemetzincin